MFYCVNFGNDGRAVCKKLEAIPSPWGGSGDVKLTLIYSLFIGGCLIQADPISIQSSQITAVSSRSTLDEDDEPWQELWFRDGGWSYAGDHALEQIILGQDIKDV